MEVDLQNEKDAYALVASIPVLRVKRDHAVSGQAGGAAKG